MSRPNIVFILADDLGWNDLSCEGSPIYESPNIDRIANEGMRFTQGYASCQVCSPSRASILTGKVTPRHGITDWIGAKTGEAWRELDRHTKLLPPEYDHGLRKDETTFVQVLKNAGYRTFFAGKWHLGEEGNHPEQFGFEKNVAGFKAGSPPGGYFSPYNNPKLEDGPPGECLPIRLGQETANWIEGHKDEPFVAYLSFYSVHGPIQTSQNRWEKYRLKALEGDQPDSRFIMDRNLPVRQIQDCPIYGGMIEAMDDAIGRLLDHLDSLDLSDDTLIVFTSDNGGFAGVADNRPLRAAKGHLYEGGIRVPLFIKWPGRIAAGSVSDESVISMDFFPTLLDAAGIRYRGSVLDGLSLLRHFTRGQPLRRDAIYFHYPNYAWHSGNRLGGAVRSGNYKLIKRYADDSLELYNLEDDLSESTNLASENPVLTANLSKKLDRWLNATGANMPIHPSTQQGSSEE